LILFASVATHGYFAREEKKLREEEWACQHPKKDATELPFEKKDATKLKRRLSRRGRGGFVHFICSFHAVHCITHA
jgi:hypothetical protein